MKPILFILLITALLIGCGGTPPTPSLTTPSGQDTEALPTIQLTATTASTGEGDTPVKPIDGYPPQEESAYPEGSTISEVQEGLPAASYPAFQGTLFFHSTRVDSSLKIFSINGADGSYNLHTDATVAAGFEPTLSPNCGQLAFAGPGPTEESFSLYTSALDGSDVKKIVENSDGFDSYAPAWSPEGSTIAYATNVDALLNVCFYDTGTSEINCLDRGNFSNATPAWSSDGNQLLFTSNRDGDWEIYSMDFPNGEPRQLTDNTHSDLRPQFSADNATIAYDSNPLGQFEIFTMSSDGSNVTQLTQDGDDDKAARWVDGRLVWTSYRTLDGDLYIMNSDGNSKARLTNEIGLDSDAIWCPSP